MNILFIGDVVGKPGRDYLTTNLGKIRKEYNVDFCIANGENSAHGKSATVETARQMFSAGVDFITMGNHTYNRNVEGLFDSFDNIIRPANYPAALPGNGFAIYDTGNFKIGIINLLARVYMDPIDSPFTLAKSIVSKIKDDCNAIIIDFHGEVTSEKAALAHFMDGLVTAVIGTHTHVQTADEIILPGETAFITDAGMTGVLDSILGIEKSIIIDRFANHINRRFELAEGKVQFNGVLVSCDKDGKAKDIKRINIR